MLISYWYRYCIYYNNVWYNYLYCNNCSKNNFTFWRWVSSSGGRINNYLFTQKGAKNQFLDMPVDTPIHQCALRGVLGLFFVSIRECTKM